MIKHQDKLHKDAFWKCPQRGCRRIQSAPKVEPQPPKPNAAVMKETIKVLQRPPDLTQGKSPMTERRCSICHHFA